MGSVSLAMMGVGLWVFALTALLGENWEALRNWLARRPATPTVLKREQRQIPALAGMLGVLTGIACLAGAGAQPQWVLPGALCFLVGAGVMLSSLLTLSDVETQEEEAARRPLSPRLRMPQVRERRSP